MTPSKQNLLYSITIVTIGSLLILFLLHLHGQIYAANTNPKANTPSIDWPTYSFDNNRQGYNPFETHLSPANAGSLAINWQNLAMGRLFASPTLANGVIYEGSLNGNLYAINAITGKVIWKKFLGTYSTSNCSAHGIYASAVVDSGNVYIGVGPNFYSLNASTGATNWQHMVGPDNNSFVWAAAAVANGKIYIGTASLCDNPLNRGDILALDPSNGNILATTYIVGPTQLGGGIWSSPAIDSDTGTVIVSTGSLRPNDVNMAASLVTLDWNTLAVKQYWQVPKSQRIHDADFGCSPTLFPENGGKTYFGCINKNSIYYVFDEANVSSGPVWEQKLGPGGGTGGRDGSIASSAYANNVLYIPSALATVNGQSYPGSIGAFNATTGQELWRFGTSGAVDAAVTTANGLVLDEEGDTLEVRNATDGSILFSFSTPTHLIYSSAIVANGFVYVASMNQHLYSFTAP